MDQRDSFDSVADLYAEVRRGYPAALYDDLTTLAGLSPDSAVLEVGCGGGQATGDLAARARHVTALDPGAQLVEQARARIAAPNVDFVVSRFETCEAPPAAFDLVASAQAWHWVDPAIAHAKAAQALKPGGFLAIFGHVPLPPAGSLNAAFKAIYERHMPGAWDTPPPQAAYRPGALFDVGIDASGLFGPVTHRAYAWAWRLDPQTLGRYLRTDSSYHVLPEHLRFALFDELAQAVADEGGVLDSPWETHLYVAARR
jgi:SAM-dependent methyltransferase